MRGRDFVGSSAGSSCRLFGEVERRVDPEVKFENAQFGEELMYSSLFRLRQSRAAKAVPTPAKARRVEECVPAGVVEGPVRECLVVLNPVAVRALEEELDDTDVALSLKRSQKGLPGPLRDLAMHFSPIEDEDVALSHDSNSDGRAGYFPMFGVMVGGLTPEAAAALGRDTRVQRVDEVPAVELIDPKDEGRASREDVAWGLEAMGIDELWQYGLTGKGVRVGLLDSGLDAQHPAFTGAVADFRVFDDHGGVRKVPQLIDSDSHGTHTGGTIAGRVITAQRRIGVAPEAELVVGTVIKTGRVLSRLLAGLQWIVDQKVRVLNLSLGFKKPPPASLQRIFGTVRRGNAKAGRGPILPVCAIGNDAPKGGPRAPGLFPQALSVGAVHSSLKPARFSATARLGRRVVPTVLAPGVRVLSAAPGGSYRPQTGTSMAAPHITGLAALLFEACPEATPDDVQHAIVYAKKNGVPRGMRALNELKRRLRRKR